MADNIMQVSDLSPIKFRDESYVNPGPYNTKYTDDWNYEDVQNDFTDTVEFAQPIQKNDIYPLQLLANFDGPFQLEIYNDCNGQLAAPIQSMNNIPASTDVTGLKVFQSTTAFNNLDNGFYRARIQGGNPVVKTLVSEKFEVNDLFPNSCLLQYKHRRNDFDVVFETGIQFSMRIPGGLRDFEPGVRRVVYIDQIEDSVLLSGKAFQLWKLVVGNYEGVPNYIIERVANVFNCSEVLIDGRQFVAVDASKFDAARVPVFSLTGWEFAVREAKARISKRFIAPANEGINASSVVYNVSSTGFGSISNPASDNTLQIEEVNI